MRSSPRTRAERFGVKDYLEARTSIHFESEGKNGTEYVCECPDCGKRKLYVNAKSGKWTCYFCERGGGLVSLVMFLDGSNPMEARGVVDRATGIRLSPSVEELEHIAATEDDEDIAPVAPVAVELPEGFVPVYDPVRRHWSVPSYLRARGIRARTAERYCLGYCTTGRYQGRLILPFHCFGELRTWQGRAMGDWSPPYMSATTPKGHALFGLDEAIGAAQVVLTEGPFDTLSLAQRGFPAVALAGKSISMTQVVLLRRAGFRRVVVMLDEDEPGIQASVKVALAIGELLDVAVAHLPDGRDPDEVSTEVVRETVLAAREPRLSDLSL